MDPQSGRKARHGEPVTWSRKCAVPVSSPFDVLLKLFLLFRGQGPLLIPLGLFAHAGLILLIELEGTISRHPLFVGGAMIPAAKGKEMHGAGRFSREKGGCPPVIPPRRLVVR